MAFLSAAGGHVRFTNPESPRREPEKSCTSEIIWAYFWQQSPLVLSAWFANKKDMHFHGTIGRRQSGIIKSACDAIPLSNSPSDLPHAEVFRRHSSSCFSDEVG